jgi:hypothetical protein
MGKTEKSFQRKREKSLLVNESEIKKPLSSLEFVTKIFCSGCGTIYEIDLERARQIFPLPDKEYRDVFFISSHCNVNCHDGEKIIKYTKNFLI